MQALDEHGEPNFNDSDYQLAAYAAALKVLTRYSNLDGRDVADEVFAVRSKNEKSDFEQVIERAITIACDALIPKGLNDSWRNLNLIERYYLRAVDIESRGERRKGMYEELARGFGVADIKPLLKSDKANGTRVHTPSGFGTSLLAPIDGAVESAAALPRRGRASASGPHPFAASPCAICSLPSARQLQPTTIPIRDASTCATPLVRPTGAAGSRWCVYSTGWLPSATRKTPLTGPRTQRQRASWPAG